MTFGTIFSFYGNPGSGKSTLCNAKLRKTVFKSGVSVGTGLTTFSESHQDGNNLIIDSPGLADPIKRNEAAKQIESSLKKVLNIIDNIDYPEVTLESGRVRLQDVETLNSILKAITVEFEYGLIINKVTKQVHQHLLSSPANLQACIQMVEKQPLRTLIVKHMSELYDEDNVLVEDKETLDSLNGFLESLPRNFIEQKDVTTVEVKDYDKKVKEMELLMTKLTEQIELEKENNKKLGEKTLKLEADLTQQRLESKESTERMMNQILDMNQKQIEQTAEFQRNMQEQMRLTTEALNKPPVIIEKGGSGPCSIM
ncbi:hypothetical protein PPL_06920 [Heterostelium album PN500]|uniref:G domain-containing protein n=1 Tax=Heterostelium pallidum (strain ATCC 26659 / Pp 5 / PN500) TaxID=670386 RepID=D3BDW7_HETP5|nr:hypothetical protein PPL_06920 [Heterostelium album PN500]EFA80098.1 hypothetical protein PPL_06920 [Heterostelium album PN500]|eukprot:XP_020432218.1 hypothetical protein PPL_06920 [Heterostelium album PN500]